MGGCYGSLLDTKTTQEGHSRLIGQQNCKFVTHDAQTKGSTDRLHESPECSVSLRIPRLHVVEQPWSARMNESVFFRFWQGGKPPPPPSEGARFSPSEGNPPLEIFDAIFWYSYVFQCILKTSQIDLYRNSGLESHFEFSKTVSDCVSYDPKQFDFLTMFCQGRKPFPHLPSLLWGGGDFTIFLPFNKGGDNRWNE